MQSPPSPPWWRPDIHRDRRPALLARNRIKAAMRAWFEARGFVEVEAAALQPSGGAEAHLHAFETRMIGEDGAARRMFLHTSPEFACKKLLAAGETAIFDFARVWRNRERGDLHHPEFTLLEWYRAGAPYQVLMEDCAALVALAAETAGTRRFRFRGARGRSLRRARARHPGRSLSPLRRHRPDGQHRRRRSDRPRRPGGRGDGGGRPRGGRRHLGDVFSRVLVERIEPNLGQGRATVLYEYPSAQAALARRKPGDARVAERFELYACGVELANCFGELTDPVEQRARFEAELAEKARVYGQRHPVDEDFLAALALMPEASGAALGFDRLVMLAVGATRLDQVLWTPLA